MIIEDIRIYITQHGKTADVDIKIEKEEDVEKLAKVYGKKVEIIIKED